MAKTNKGVHRTGAADVFIYLLQFLVLFISVIFFLQLLFNYVDTVFPPPFSFFTQINNEIIVAVSTLLIVWPVFVILAWVTGRQTQKEPARHGMQLRKWLIYLTLFVAAVTIIIDLVLLVNNFLSGGLTISFFLKTFSVLIVTGAVFGYYIWDVRRTYKKIMQPKIILWVASGVLLIAIVGGFFLAGTPGQQRDRRFDDQRIQDLQQIQSEIFFYWQSKQVLPATVVELENDITGFSTPMDPKTDQPYGYSVIDKQTFELCTVFAAEGQGFEEFEPIPARSVSDVAVYPSPEKDSWDHGAGLTCFEREIDPDLLLPISVEERVPTEE